MQHGWFSRAIVVRLLALIFVFLFGFFVGQRKTRVVQAQRTANVPKAWGHCEGGNESGLIFEDSNGVVRVVRLTDGALSLRFHATEHREKQMTEKSA